MIINKIILKKVKIVNHEIMSSGLSTYPKRVLILTFFYHPVGTRLERIPHSSVQSTFYFRYCPITLLHSPWKLGIWTELADSRSYMQTPHV